MAENSHLLLALKCRSLLLAYTTRRVAPLDAQPYVEYLDTLGRSDRGPIACDALNSAKKYGASTRAQPFALHAGCL